MRRAAAFFCRDERGAMAMLMSMMLVGLFGFVAVAVDTSVWYSTKRRLQTAVDSAARAGAHELDRGGSEEQISAAGAAAAARMGFAPADGANIRIEVREDNSVRAVIRSRAHMYFAKVLRATAPTLSASAAAAAPSAPPPCLTILEPSDAQALNIDKAKIVAPTCRIQVNSTSAEAMKIAGGATVDAAQICVTGNYSGGGTSVPVDIGCAPLSDPLAAWVPPDPGPCEFSPNTIKETTTTLKPGVYCKQIQIDKATVTFLPGIYFLKNGGLKVQGDSVITGKGVGFLLIGDSKIEIEAKSVIDLAAPVDGPMAGFVFAHDRNPKAGLEHKFVAHSDISYEGAVYLPKHYVTYQGHSTSSNIPPFTTYIVGRLKMDGQSELILNNNYAASAVPVAGKIGAGVVLVE